MDIIKILFISADPTDISRLRLGQELRDIREKLQLSKWRDCFILESREAVRPGDITQAIFDVEPQIVHFSGHGLKTGELCFENVTGKAQPIPSTALSSLFHLVSRQVKCVILNACHSKAQAEAISEHISFVIGMSQEIGDKAAITFAVGFYKALGAGRSYEDAYKFACVEIEMESLPEHFTPTFYTANSNEVKAVKKIDSHNLKITDHNHKIESDLNRNKKSDYSLHKKVLNRFYEKRYYWILSAIVLLCGIFALHISPVIKKRLDENMLLQVSDLSSQRNYEGCIQKATSLVNTSEFLHVKTQASSLLDSCKDGLVFADPKLKVEAVNRFINQVIESPSRRIKTHYLRKYEVVSLTEEQISGLNNLFIEFKNIPNSSEPVLPGSVTTYETWRFLCIG